MNYMPPAPLRPLGFVLAALILIILAIRAADTNHDATAPSAATTPPLLSSSRATNANPPAPATPSRTPVYIVPRVTLVQTPQGLLAAVAEHHVLELARLGFQTVTVTNLIIYAPAP